MTNYPHTTFPNTYIYTKVLGYTDSFHLHFIILAISQKKITRIELMFLMQGGHCKQRAVHVHRVKFATKVNLTDVKVRDRF